MGARARLVLAATVAVVGWSGLVAQAEAFVYWTNGSAMQRANLDGSGGGQNLIGGGQGAYGLAVDGRHVYWTNVLARTIGRANLDGTGANPRFLAGNADAFGLAVDDRHIYWTNYEVGTIGRANLDGTGANPSFITGVRGVWGLAVDDRYIYWTNYATHTIGRANLDGSGADDRFVVDVGWPGGLAVDDRYIYWADEGSGSIGRVRLDGSGADFSFIAGMSGGWAVAVDDLHIYWTDEDARAIGRANLDGSGAEYSFIAASFPRGLAIDGGPAGSAVPSAASVSFKEQPVGTLAPPQSVTITNEGHGNLKIDAARVTSGDVNDFLVSHDTCSQRTLTIAATCAVYVRFAPSATGDRQATLTVTSNDPDAPLQIGLQGIGG